MVGNPLAALLTPAVVKQILAGPPIGLQGGLQILGGPTGGLLAGLEDTGVQSDFDEDMADVTSARRPLLRSWGINTDIPRYVTQTGKVVRQGRKTQYAPADLETVVRRLKMSVPVLKYAKVDAHLRMMVLASLLKMSRDKNKLMPAPQGLLLHPLTSLQHEKYRQTLGGITEDNVKEVTTQLRKLVPE